MDWLRTHRQSAWIVGVTLAVPVVLVLYALGSLLSARADIQSQIDRLEPRVARVEGLTVPFLLKYLCILKGQGMRRLRNSAWRTRV